jgi:DNA-binding NarL/FixJ family response regulator
VVRADTADRAARTVLTTRELEVVRMAAQGLRNKEIASRLFISEGTVKIHLHNAYEKLGVDGRVQLLLYVKEKGLT